MPHHGTGVYLGLCIEQPRNLSKRLAGMSGSSTSRVSGEVQDGHRILYKDDAMAPTKVLTQETHVLWAYSGFALPSREGTKWGLQIGTPKKE